MSFMKDREADLKDGPVVAESPQLEGFGDAERDAILGLLVTLGDNKYKLGRRYSEWGTAAPTLEASVAAASMTADEMGHARSLYPLLKQFPGAPPELKKEEDRTNFHNVSFLDEPWEAWTDFIAVAALFGRAMSTVVQSLRKSAYEPFRHRAAKMLQEEHYHRLYAEGWLEILAAEAGSRELLKEAMNSVWEETLAWFGPDGDPLFSTAAAAGVTDANGIELRRRFTDEIKNTVSKISGIGFPEDTPIAWNRWNAESRRYNRA